MGSITLNVTERSSSSFSASIYHNCGAYSPDNFTIQANRSIDYNCTFTNNGLFNATTYEIKVNCHVSNQAGRPWNFTFQLWSGGSSLKNESFEVTLKPLPLKIEPIIDSATINSVSAKATDCEQIADLSTLSYTCNAVNLLANKTLSRNCTMTCDGLQPGSDVTITLTRSSISSVDLPTVVFDAEQQNTTAKTCLFF